MFQISIIRHAIIFMVDISFDNLIFTCPKRHTHLTQDPLFFLENQICTSMALPNQATCPCSQDRQDSLHSYWVHFCIQMFTAVLGNSKHFTIFVFTCFWTFIFSTILIVTFFRTSTDMFHDYCSILKEQSLKSKVSTMSIKKKKELRSPMNSSSLFNDCHVFVFFFQRNVMIQVKIFELASQLKERKKRKRPMSKCKEWLKTWWWQ